MKKDNHKPTEALPGGISRAQLNAWKAKYTDAYCITIEDDEGNRLAAWFRKPDIDCISAAARYAESDPMKSGLVVFNTCVLHCDAGIEADDNLKISVMNKLGELMKVREAELKKY